MVPVIDQPRSESPDSFETFASTPHTADVPGLMADRIGRLYAEEERISRLARTERLIRAAKELD